MLKEMVLAMLAMWSGFTEQTLERINIRSIGNSKCLNPQHISGASPCHMLFWE